MSYIPFTKRGQQPPKAVSDDISEVARKRVWHHIVTLCGAEDNVFELFRFAHDRTLLEHGELSRRRTYKVRNVESAIFTHYMKSDADEFLEFLELLLQVEYFQPVVDKTVEGINAVFREEGIGYRFSERIVNRIDDPVVSGRYRLDITYPIAMKTGEDVTHTNIIQPALHVLGKSVFKDANDELLHAHQHFKKGEWSDAIGDAGKALESVLKIICDHKGWTFSPDTDVLSRLVDTCNTNKLFSPFYVEILKNCGTIRNRLGGHGKAKTTHEPATESTAEHMLNLVSTNILLLVRLAKM